jgi:hypothetical protein
MRNLEVDDRRDSSKRDDVRRHSTPERAFGAPKLLCFSVGTRPASQESAARTEAASRTTEGESTMSHIAEANAIIAKAKQQRAEYIGTSLQAHALPIAAVVALSFAFLQFTGEPEMEQQFEAQSSQVSTITG